MADTDKIIAAIFTASMCGGNADQATYLQTYDGFIDLMKQRARKKPPPLKISSGALARAAQRPPRR